MYKKKPASVNSTGHTIFMRAFCNTHGDYHMEQTQFLTFFTKKSWARQIKFAEKFYIAFTFQYERRRRHKCFSVNFPNFSGIAFI